MSTCAAWVLQDGLHMAASGSAGKVAPGLFMKALTSVTKNAEAAPLTATATPENRCRWGETRSRP